MFNIAKLNPFHREPTPAPKIEDRVVLCKVVGVLSDHIIKMQDRGFPEDLGDMFLADLMRIGSEIGYNPLDRHHHTLLDWDHQEWDRDDKDFDTAVTEALDLFR